MADEFGFIRIQCPWCHLGEILADSRAKVRVSVICPVCRKNYIANLQDMKGYRPNEEPGRKRRSMIALFPCPCPFCKGETRTDGYADARVFIKCSKKRHSGYSRYYIVDLLTGETKEGSSIRKRGRK